MCLDGGKRIVQGMHVPLRRQLREAVDRARLEASQRGEPLTWQTLAERAGLSTPGTMRKMLQGDAPVADDVAARIAAAVGYELVLRRARSGKR